MATQPLVIKNYRQQAMTVLTAGGAARKVQVSFDVYQGDNLVAHHTQDYSPSQADSATITKDVQKYVGDLKATLQAAANLQG